MDLTLRIMQILNSVIEAVLPIDTANAALVMPVGQQYQHLHLC
jgi:hypothetical protein